MHLTEHISDVQLNEYLDNEIPDRAVAEKHLAECAHCAARLAALQTLFDEIESLPEAELSKSLATRFTRDIELHAPLPHSLRLTVVLQAALAALAMIIAAPIITKFVLPYFPSFDLPPFPELFIQIQSRWITWLDMLSQFELPTVPKIPAVEVSSLVITLTLASVSIFWLVGNGLLLRNQTK